MEVFEAVAQPKRREILRLLSGGELSAGAIAAQFDITQPAVSQHLKVLKETGWIEGEVDGPRVCYCPAAGVMARFKQLIQSLESGERR